MPVEFLTDEQAEAYGKFAEEPTRPEHHQLGFALQMCTVRYVGRFLPDDPVDVPWPVVEHLAAQLGIKDPSCVKRYTERSKCPSIPCMEMPCSTQPVSSTPSELR